MIYSFPRGACETPIYFWPDGTGTHLFSSLINFSIVLGILKTLRYARLQRLPFIFSILLWTEVAFESVHGICHAKHDAFGDNCFAVQHATGLTMLSAFFLIIETMRGTVVGPKLIMTVMGILITDFLMYWLQFGDLERVQFTLLLFSVIFIRGSMLSSIFETPKMRIAATAMIVETLLFYIDGTRCEEFRSIVPFISPHVIFESIGALIFYITNSVISAAMINRDIKCL